MSADSGLLDVFAVRDEPDSSAGRLALSDASSTALQAMLQAATKKEISAGATNISTTEAAKLATSVSTKIGRSAATGNPVSGNPLLNRADLVRGLAASYPASFTATTDLADKAYAEAPVRALSNMTDTRTWTLLIDVIAQVGRLTPNATTLQNFLVEGERHYWLHVAIDRYTGKVINEQLEPVYE